MLVNKILARPYHNLGPQAARRLMEDLDGVRWALGTVQTLAEEDESGRLSKRFEQWRLRIDERRARLADIYPQQIPTPEMRS